MQPIACRNASSSSFTDRLRKRIWGTDEPLGQKDPYGGPGIIERRRQEQELRKGTSASTSPNQQETATYEYDLDDVPEESNATTWEGMPVVGGPDWGIDIWEEENPFEGFMANSRLHSSEEIIPIIHRALVEITALKEANLPLRIDKNASSPTHEYMYHVARGAGFQSSHGGEVSLKFDHEDLRQAILEYIQPSESPGEVAVSGDEEQVENALAEESVEDEAPPDAVVGENTASTGALESSDAAESEGPMASEPLLEEVDDSQPIQDSNSYVPKDRNWRRVSLADPEIKFAVLKRVMQLTGRRIPDPDIAHIQDPKTLLAHLVKKPKPKKLAEALSTNKAIDLPNVEVRERRFTPIDREKEVGRWKVIERELEARGLPVTGKGTVAVGEALI